MFATSKVVLYVGVRRRAFKTLKISSTKRSNRTCPFMRFQALSRPEPNKQDILGRSILIAVDVVGCCIDAVRRPNRCSNRSGCHGMSSRTSLLAEVKVSYPLRRISEQMRHVSTICCRRNKLPAYRDRSPTFHRETRLPLCTESFIY